MGLDAQAPGQKVRIGVVGGDFGAAFCWHEHPDCVVQAVAELHPGRRDHLMKTYQCERAYGSLEELLKDDAVDAVAVFTPATEHARHCIAVMNAGKHVLSAVPACVSLEEAHMLKETKERSDRIYMMAETSYYRQYTIAARELYEAGAFGELFYSEVEYYHPGICTAGTAHSYLEGERTWRYGFPPMHYPTHSTGFLVGVTGERLTEVSCLGWADPDEPALKDNVYDNPFSAEMALFKTDRGHMCRCGVFWHGVADGERAQWFGKDLALYAPGSGGQPFRIDGANAPKWKKPPDYLERLPKPLRHGSSHGGSHTFLTHEFISAIREQREPTVDVYEALAMTVPGVIAHQSALKGGEQLGVPDFGRASG